MTDQEAQALLDGCPALVVALVKDAVRLAKQGDEDALQFLEDDGGCLAFWLNTAGMGAETYFQVRRWARRQRLCLTNESSKKYSNVVNLG